MSTNQLMPIAVSIPDACKLSGLGRSFLYEKLTDGSIRSVKVGTKKRLVLVASIQAYLESLPTATASQLGGVR